MMANDFYIYVGTHPKTQEPCYVGKGRKYRIRKHDRLLRLGIHANAHLQNIYSKYGPIPWSKVLEGLTEAEAFEAEIALISHFGRANSGTGLLCNLTDGGDGVSGHRHDETARAKMRGPKSDAHRAALRAANLGKKHPADIRMKISKAHKGIARSQEHRENLSKALKGKRPSANTLAAYRAANVGRKLTPEHVAKIGRSGPYGPYQRRSNHHRRRSNHTEEDAR